MAVPPVRVEILASGSIGRQPLGETQILSFICVTASVTPRMAPKQTPCRRRNTQILSGCIERSVMVCMTPAKQSAQRALPPGLIHQSWCPTTRSPSCRLGLRFPVRRQMQSRKGSIPCQSAEMVQACWAPLQGFPPGWSMGPNPYMTVQGSTFFITSMRDIEILPCQRPNVFFVKPCQGVAAAVRRPRTSVWQRAPTISPNIANLVE